MLVHHLNAALARPRAVPPRRATTSCGTDEVVIVDEFTGRTMAGPALVGRAAPGGRGQGRASRSRQENQTLASITFQNYFRIYDKLAGMTGTADTEAAEFQQIYGLEVGRVPTHLAMVRDDGPISSTSRRKRSSRPSLDEIGDCATRRAAGPGRYRVDRDVGDCCSGCCASAVSAPGAERQAARARSAIIAQAGEPGAVTIATNMAGRGTDIVLGGNCRGARRTVARRRGRRRSGTAPGRSVTKRW